MRPEPLSEMALETTEDAVLGGRLRLRQPRRGHRVGHDAILLAAATAAYIGENAVEFGAGVGAAGLALALRVPGLRITLVDIDPALCALARENAIANGLSERVSAAVLNVTASPKGFAAAGLVPGWAERVLMNPPFNDATSHRCSPEPARARAHAGAAGLLASWIAAANRLLTSGGTVTLIWRADGLAEVLENLKPFGAIAVLPVHAHAEAAAVRVLVQAVKGSRAPMQLRPALILQDAAGRPTAAAEAVLRDCAPLTL